MKSPIALYNRFWCLLGEHRRSAQDRVHLGHGLYRSHCERCGRPMVRSQLTGKWSVYHDRDARPDFDRKDELIGPAVFVILLAAVTIAFILVRSGGLPHFGR